MRLIAIEGPDGSGKTTLIERLKRHYQRAEFHTAITDSIIGKQIRQILAGKIEATPRQLQALMTADRVWRDFENDGDQLRFVDRWTLSAYVYGSVHLEGEALHRELDWLRRVNAPVQKAEYIVLCAPPEVLLARMAGRAREIYETPKTLRKVSARYVDIAETMLNAQEYKFVSASGTADEVYNEVARVLAAKGFHR